MSKKTWALLMTGLLVPGGSAILIWMLFQTLKKQKAQDKPEPLTDGTNSNQGMITDRVRDGL